MTTNKNRNHRLLLIALGAGLGTVFGGFIFGNPGAGLAVGAGLGIIVGALKNKKSTSS